MKRGVSRFFVIVALVSASALLFSAAAYAAGGTTFGFTDVKARVGNARDLWNTGMRALAPYSISDYGSGAWAVWKGDSTFDDALLFTDLYDNGRDMGPIRKLPTGSVNSSSVNVAWTNSPADADGTVHVIYDHSSAAYYTRNMTPNSGNYWSTPALVSGTYSVYLTSVAADPGSSNVYVAFSTHYDSIYVARNTYGGDPAYWETPVLVSNASDRLFLTGIVVDSSGTVHVAYVDDNTGQLLYQSSTNGGVTWGNATVVSGTYNVPGWWSASVTVSGSGSLYFSYISSSGVTCAYKSGSTWAQSVVATPAGTGSETSIALSPNGEVNIAWYDSDGSKYNVYFSRSKNGGATWLPSPVLVRADAVYANLAMDADNKAMIMFSDRWDYQATFTREQ